MSPKGYLTIFLHAHLPYVRHPEYENFLEEDWLYEAITETYIPLIQVLNRLLEDDVPFRLTISLSPTLISMFGDPLLQNRYVRHLEKLIELAEKEIVRTRSLPAFYPLALMYYEQFVRSLDLFNNRYRKNLIIAFQELSSSGSIELITTCATHGYLPLMELYPTALKAQVEVGLQCFERSFGFRPKGFWLPECGFHPVLDQILHQSGIRYSFVDTHGILLGHPRPRYGIFAPIYSSSSVAFFGRDAESSRAVWSAKEGYPGDPVYREFYRDIGYDLGYDYIRSYVNGDGTRTMTGIKYYRITGNTQEKQPYVPQLARERAAQHAGNFMFNREKQVEYVYDFIARQPIIVSPYDAELLGHWWFEGPQWLDFLLRKIAYDQRTLQTTTPSEYLEQFKEHQIVTPSLSSWGWKGYSEVWLNGANDWIYRHIHKITERMIEQAQIHRDQPMNSLYRRVLNQMARELLLAQSSDWAFILNSGSCVEYAQRRLQEHIGRFNSLYEQIQSGQILEGELSRFESIDNIFPEIDYRVYAS